MEPANSDPDIIVDRLISETADLENDSESGILFPHVDMLGFRFLKAGLELTRINSKNENVIAQL